VQLINVAGYPYFSLVLYSYKYRLTVQPYIYRGTRMAQ
jgi:hypothetical protein